MAGIQLTPIRVTHWMGPNGVECLTSLDETVLVSNTDPRKVTCEACWRSMPKLSCERCEGSGADPEKFSIDPRTGERTPEACEDCRGSGEDTRDDWEYDDDDGYRY